MPAHEGTTPTAVLEHTAVNLLKSGPRFRHTSRRLLADLVEKVGMKRITDTEQGEQTSVADVHPEVLVVVEGTLLVTPPRQLPPGELAPAVESPAPPVLPEHLGGPVPAVELSHGVYNRRHRPPFEGFEKPLHLQAPKSRTAHVLAVTSDHLKNARRASPSFAHGLAPGVEDVGRAIPAQLIWVAKAPELNAPLEALVQLLAAAIARDFHEPTAIVTLGKLAELAIWKTDRFVPAGPVTGSAGSGDAIVAALTAYLGPSPKLHHLLFIHPSDPNVLPEPFANLRFTRIVYVTDGVPTRIPHGLEKLLRKEVFPNDTVSSTVDPYFSSFVTSVLLKAKRPDSSSSLGLSLSAFLQTQLQPTEFEDEPLDDGFALDAKARRPRGSATRLERDLCRLRFDTSALAAEWSAWKARTEASTASFPVTLFDERPEHPEYRETASRWARAVTNRRIGLALSGGGATSYRMVPLIWMLHRLGMPVDVFSGVSGGALIGAYYCKGELEGLKLAVEQGPWFKRATLGAMITSRCVELLVDYDLGGAKLDELEVRFVPATTALPEGGPPEARAVTGGTLGEAVRASGSLPVGYGPTEKHGTRYADGSTATLIPAKVVTDYGADIVFACNCIPSVTRGNPFEDYVLGRLAYRYTPIGRLIDGWVATAFLLNQAGRKAAGGDADVFFGPSPVDIPLIEMSQFQRASDIIERSRRDDGGRMHALANKFHALWRRLGTPEP